jgi:hypothetical protein
MADVERPAARIGAPFPDVVADRRNLVVRAWQRPSSKDRKGPLTWYFAMVAGEGFEPSTFGL